MVSVGHDGQSGQVMVGHETVGQMGQFCSGQSVEIIMHNVSQGLLYIHCVYMCNEPHYKIWPTDGCSQDPVYIVL